MENKPGPRMRLLKLLETRCGQLSHALQRKIARDFVCPPRADDVYVAAYPGSGAPVLQMMLYQLTTDGSLDFPHVESVVPSYSQEILAGNAALLGALPSPRLFYTFDLRHQLPRRGRFLYLVRNLKDVAVAMYHRYRLITGADVDLDFYLDLFLSGQLPVGSWFEHTRSWWPHRHDDDVLFLVYDDVVANLEGTARRVAAFCGFDLDGRVPRVAARSRPEFLRELDEKFDPRLRRFSRTPVGTFIRKGRAGGGKDVFHGRRAQRLEKKLRALARRLDGPCDDPRRKLLSI